MLIGLPESNLEKWLRAMDFSKIENLHLAQDEPLFYERMKDALPGLRHLSFDWMNSGTQVPAERLAFICSALPLESLSVTISAPWKYNEGSNNRTQFPLRNILDQHGSTLESLVLKQREGDHPMLRRPMLSVDEISTIGDCPNLKHLTLDIDRDASTGWPNSTFDAITRISGLDSLTLRLEMGADLHSGHESGDYYWNPEGLDGPGPFREPRMSLSVSNALFDDLRHKKLGSALQRVQFVVGDHEDRPHSGSLYIPSWDEGRSRTFLCEASESGEDTGSCCRTDGDKDPWD